MGMGSASRMDAVNATWGTAAMHVQSSGLFQTLSDATNGSAETKFATARAKRRSGTDSLRSTHVSDATKGGLAGTAMSPCAPIIVTTMAVVRVRGNANAFVGTWGLPVTWIVGAVVMGPAQGRGSVRAMPGTRDRAKNVFRVVTAPHVLLRTSVVATPLVSLENVGMESANAGVVLGVPLALIKSPMQQLIAIHLQG